MDDAVLQSFERAGAAGLLRSGKWGLEREALRVDRKGDLASTAHPFPPDRGDITVDFAENQIEFVTKPLPSAEEALAELASLHAEAYGSMGDELLWPLSAPGSWNDPEALKPARFAGAPDKGGARRYRDYLLERYGRARQAISGVHFNFSYSGEFWDFLRRAEGAVDEGRRFTDRRYMDLARNILRFRFLPVFLFSASPSIDPRFEAELRGTADDSASASIAACAGRTASLRLGPLGYRLAPALGERIDIRFSSLDEYLDKLEAACRPNGGDAPLLVSASEYYAPIRPKTTPKGDKGSLSGLRERGIEYLELRLFDLDPFEALGIGQRAMAFAQVFALACLLMPSPPLERDAASEDPLSFAASACSLDPAGGPVESRLREAIKRAASDIIAMMDRIAPLLGPNHAGAVAWATEVLSGKTPRAVERFARLASSDGGGLAAGLFLAREHRRSLMEGRVVRKEAS